MAYTKRYAGGFVDLPSQTTAVDSQYLNATEASLLRVDGADPTVDGQVMQWIAANSKYGPALLLNKNIDPAAAIAWSKINSAGAIFNADVAGAAAIDKSKINLGGGLTNADIAAGAAIAPSKLAGYPSDVSKGLRGDGSWLTASTLLAAQMTTVTVTNPAALTQFFSFSIPANTMGTIAVPKFLRAVAWGTVNNNSGAGRNLTFQLNFGGSALWQAGLGNLVGTSGDLPWRIEIDLALNTDTGHITMSGRLQMDVTVGTPTAGLGLTAPGTDVINANFQPLTGVATVDSTAVQTLSLFINSSAATATQTYKCNHARVEVAG